MIIKTSLSLSDPTRTCQVSAELELDNQATADQISTKTSELLIGLQSGFAEAIASSPIKNVTPPSEPQALSLAIPKSNGNQKALPIGAVPNKRKQRPNDQPTPGQRKYLNDLLQKNGLNLASWCQEKNVPENQITAAHCQQWIPELKDRLKNNGIPF